MEVNSPSDRAILLALHNFISQNPTMGLSKLRQLIRASHPEWPISSKVINFFPVSAVINLMAW
jgi:hypothetical protein